MREQLDYNCALKNLKGKNSQTYAQVALETLRLFAQDSSKRWEHFCGAFTH
jgi:hypothetical protein